MTPPPADLADAKKKFTGAMVYHKGGNDIPVGIYVWNGTNWTSMEENCKSPTLTLTAPFFIKPGVSVSFSVSSDASPRCAAGETYEWFKATSPGGIADTPFGSGTDATASFASVGTYRVKVIATSPYSAPVEKEVTVAVTADGALDPEMLSNTYGIVGETCLDVKKSDQGKSAAVFNARTDAFEDSFTKEYKFVHGNSYTDLNLSYIDDPAVNIVTGITPPPVSANGNSEETFTVTFNSNVKNMVPVNGDSLTVKLLASYKNSDNESKLAWLEIRVEDGTCICPAKKDANTWLNYMCHNLGGLDIISPSQLITYEHHGDWYRFGAKNPSLVNTGTNNGTVDNWTVSYHADYPFYTGNGNWPVDETGGNGLANPCPAGWRLPDHTELSALINKNTSNGNIAEINLLSDVPAPWMAYESDNSVFCNLKKFGDNLYLPAAGWRRSDQNGQLGNRGGGGDYWSSTGYGTDRGRSIVFSAFGVPNSTLSGNSDHYSGISVRCVEAE
jgi:uncharacterized protein (TIGR02145 family)